MRQDIIIRFLCILIGYVFGNFQSAYFYGKLVGTDIRQHGSGNLGTTNALRVLGPKAGGIVLAGDMLKTILAILLTWLLFGRGEYANIHFLFLYYTALGVILGHDFPVWLKFKGGKGIACTAGLILSMHWSLTIAGILLFFPEFFIFHYVSIGSLLVNLGFVAWTVIAGQTGWLFSSMTQSERVELYILAILIAGLAFFQHRSNIKRLLAGKEGKVYLIKPKEI
ncbi:MAG: glycerol-3-phosphate 1-O-acyltransferase PlsY [Lachnospiraceae bacterium]|nr:glycerol-3-phosphate 1-O-acyltransferase PlsY [Lachnospiraceae bacterium]